MATSSYARILYLDDAEDWRITIGNLLREQGYEVETSESAENAFEKLRDEGPFDLAIFDMRLDETDEGNIDGAHLAIKVRDADIKVTIMILTGRALEMPTKIAQKLGRHPYNVQTYWKDCIGLGTNDDPIEHVKLLLAKQAYSKKAFAILPFRYPFLDFYEQHVKPVLLAQGVACENANEERTAGHIPGQVLKHLHESDLVIADLTGSNPNVLYELGYADAIEKPAILICRNLEDLPYGMDTRRTIKYSTSTSGTREFQKSLSKTAQATLENTVGSSTTTSLAVHPKSYLCFVPNTELGNQALKEIIQPIVSDLDLSDIRSVRTRTANSVLEETIARVKQGAVIFAEISEGNAEVYHSVGISRALRGGCVILLINKDFTPPFSLKDWPNTVTYDPTDWMTAAPALDRIRVLVKACLDKVQDMKTPSPAEFNEDLQGQ